MNNNKIFWIFMLTLLFAVPVNTQTTFFEEYEAALDYIYNDSSFLAQTLNFKVSKIKSNICISRKVIPLNKDLLLNQSFKYENNVTEWTDSIIKHMSQSDTDLTEDYTNDDIEVFNKRKSRCKYLAFISDVYKGQLRVEIYYYEPSTNLSHGLVQNDSTQYAVYLFYFDDFKKIKHTIKTYIFY